MRPTVGILVALLIGATGSSVYFQVLNPGAAGGAQTNGEVERLVQENASLRSRLQERTAESTGRDGDTQGRVHQWPSVDGVSRERERSGAPTDADLVLRGKELEIDDLRAEIERLTTVLEVAKRRGFTAEMAIPNLAGLITEVSKDGTLCTITVTDNPDNVPLDRTVGCRLAVYDNSGYKGEVRVTRYEGEKRIGKYDMGVLSCRTMRFAVDPNKGGELLSEWAEKAGRTTPDFPRIKVNDKVASKIY
ncbi:MAG: hypothetical protein WAT39_04205 [Planctomycetota bacterium]